MFSSLVLGCTGQAGEASTVSWFLVLRLLLVLFLGPPVVVTLSPSQVTGGGVPRISSWLLHLGIKSLLKEGFGL